jgi:hypothetical protein
MKSFLVGGGPGEDHFIPTHFHLFASDFHPIEQGFSTFWYLRTPNQECTPLRTPKSKMVPPSRTPQIKNSTQINLF